MQFNRSILLASIIIASCSGKRPQNMLEFYYSIPFSDKYNETLSAETKEKLFKNGQWTALEDSGFAILKTAVDEEQFSEDITIKVWNSGEVAAVTTRYDEGSDCPPINQLSLFRYNNGWQKIDLPEITLSDYWSNPEEVPFEVSNQAHFIQFEPFLDKMLNGIKLGWRYYTCFAESGDDNIPDYFEMDNKKKFEVASQKRDYDEVYLLWDSNYQTLEKSVPSKIRSKNASEDKRESGNPGTGLLLGAAGTVRLITYFITFSGNNLSIKALNGAILSPQYDDFYILQYLENVASEQCSYDEDGDKKEEECYSSITRLLITHADQQNYKADLEDGVQYVTQINNAECGLNKDEFETITWVGKNFVQYVVGGSDSECAPDGPGGGFEKDTIISFDNSPVNLLAKSYVPTERLKEIHSQLFEGSSPENSPIGFCTPEEMLIGLKHESGKLIFYAKNATGRNLQDSWEKEIRAGDAQSQFVSKPFVENPIIRELTADAHDFFVSPNGKFLVLLKTVNQNTRLYFYDVTTSTALARISFPYDVVIMEEWCDKNYWSKWNQALEEAAHYVKVQE